jgi:hypothetical protein
MNNFRMYPAGIATASFAALFLIACCALCAAASMVK